MLVKLARVANGVTRRFEFAGTIVRVETCDRRHTHGVQFGKMMPAQQTALTDCLCQVEWQYRR